MGMCECVGSFAKDDASTFPSDLNSLWGNEHVLDTRLLPLVPTPLEPSEHSRGVFARGYQPLCYIYSERGCASLGQHRTGLMSLIHTRPTAPSELRDQRSIISLAQSFDKHHRPGIRSIPHTNTIRVHLEQAR